MVFNVDRVLGPLLRALGRLVAFATVTVLGAMAHRVHSEHSDSASLGPQSEDSDSESEVSSLDVDPATIECCSDCCIIVPS